jgi:hypothetical protein
MLTAANVVQIPGSRSMPEPGRDRIASQQGKFRAVGNLGLGK